VPASYRSPKTEVRKSPIHGSGLFARAPIGKGEIVAIKGGHVLDDRALAAVRGRVAFSYVQIDDGFHLGAVRASEVRRNKLFLNHSCEPNLGIRGQITFVALRAIEAGEELTYDWAMEENAPGTTRCRCGSRRCRKVLTGQDWKDPRLQRRYRGYFSGYLQGKIDQLRSRRPSR
jgi:hypothetical protein